MVKIEWCHDAAEAKTLAALFADNLTTSYISHSEMQGLRATGPGKWAPDIAAVLEHDLVGRIGNPEDPAPNETTMLVAAIRDETDVVGVLLATFSRVAAVPYCNLEDIVIRASLRDKGYGRQALQWLDDECRRRGIFRLFLESGTRNERAHELFETIGFAPVSIVMMKSLS